MNSESLKIPENSIDFFPWLKKASETFWESTEIKNGLFGFQIQNGTKWRPGLSEEEIRDYEAELGLIFPEIYWTFLKNMNGTDKPAINIYGNGVEKAFAPGYYSFPRDLEVVKNRIETVYKDFRVHEDFVRRGTIPRIIPIIGHRFLIADNCSKNPVLSIHQNDAILYAPSLDSFLVADILQNHSALALDESEFHVEFWFDDYLKKLNG